MQCFGPEKKGKKMRSRAGGDRHPRNAAHATCTHTRTCTHTHARTGLQHRGSSALVGGLRSGPLHSTDKCLAPARPQSAFTGQQIRTDGHTPNPFTLQSVYFYIVCVCVSERERQNANPFGEVIPWNIRSHSRSIAYGIIAGVRLKY